MQNRKPNGVGSLAIEPHFRDSVRLVVVHQRSYGLPQLDDLSVTVGQLALQLLDLTLQRRIGHQRAMRSMPRQVP